MGHPTAARMPPVLIPPPAIVAAVQVGRLTEASFRCSLSGRNRTVHPSPFLSDYINQLSLCFWKVSRENFLDPDHTHRPVPARRSSAFFLGTPISPPPGRVLRHPWQTVAEPALLDHPASRAPLLTRGTLVAAAAVFVFLPPPPSLILPRLEIFTRIWRQGGTLCSSSRPPAGRLPVFLFLPGFIPLFSNRYFRRSATRYQNAIASFSWSPLTHVDPGIASMTLPLPPPTFEQEDTLPKYKPPSSYAPNSFRPVTAHRPSLQSSCSRPCQAPPMRRSPTGRPNHSDALFILLRLYSERAPAMRPPKLLPPFIYPTQVVFSPPRAAFPLPECIYSH